MTPLLPAATIDKVLEEANIAYENESQKECQDILDSIDDMLELELPNEKPSQSLDHYCPIGASSSSMLPQVDGSNDDEFSSPRDSLAGTSSLVEINSEYTRASEHHVLPNTDTSGRNKNPNPHATNNSQHHIYEHVFSSTSDFHYTTKHHHEHQPRGV